jgi:hypothetical protein
MRNNKIVPLKELVSSDTILTEVGKELRREGWPETTLEENTAKTSEVLRNNQGG